MNNDTKNILRFMLRAFLPALPVVIPALCYYFIADPFMAVRKYDNYYPDPDVYPARVGINKGIVTFADYERQTAKGIKYDSFIFGSSISCYYDAALWRDCLADSTAMPFHFDSAGESLDQMRLKVQFLDATGAPIRHALIILDPIIMAGATSDGPAHINPLPLQPSLWHKLKYHYTFFRASTNADFFKNMIPAAIYGVPYDIAHNPLFEPQPIVYNPLFNQESIPQWDQMIASAPDEFYRQHPLSKAPDSITESAPVLDASRQEALRDIADIFSRHATDYQIIISPNRRKTALNEVDRRYLESVFGPGRVHDFSRSLADELACDTLLYDNTHYRPAFARQLMERVYK